MRDFMIPFDKRVEHDEYHRTFYTGAGNLRVYLELHRYLSFRYINRWVDDLVWNRAKQTEGGYYLPDDIARLLILLIQFQKDGFFSSTLFKDLLIFASILSSGRIDNEESVKLVKRAGLYRPYCIARFFVSYLGIHNKYNENVPYLYKKLKPEGIFELTRDRKFIPLLRYLFPSLKKIEPKHGQENSNC